MSSDPTGASAVAPDPEATPPDPPARRTRPPGPKISSHEALAIATADGTPVYGGLSHFRVEIVLEADGWHIAHTIPQRPDQCIVGGGPHYVIDATTGQIVSKKYYQ